MRWEAGRWEYEAVVMRMVSGIPCVEDNLQRLVRSGQDLQARLDAAQKLLLKRSSDADPVAG